MNVVDALTTLERLAVQIDLGHDNQLVVDGPVDVLDDAEVAGLIVEHYVALQWAALGRRAVNKKTHAWAACDQCGEPRLVRVGKRVPCIMTPRCNGSHGPQAAATRAS